MNTFTVIFLAMLLLATGVQLWLSRRQIRHVSTHRDAVPEAFSGKISEQAHRRAADYTLAKVRFGMAETLWAPVLLLLWTLGGGLQLLLGLWAGTGLGPLAQGVGFMLSVFLISGLLDVPFSAYRTFVIEQRFGFNRTTPGTFAGDLLKQGALMAAIGIPLAALVLWLMGNAGELWWLWVWAVWLGFALLMMWAFPAFIAPLFNRFSPLEDKALESRIRQLLERCGFKFNGVFVMDGSRRSAHGNAYFSGLGNNKRIVFFDTLLENLSADEIEAVLAHELGHFRRKHVRKRLALMAVLSLIGLAVLGWLIDQSWFYLGLGVTEPSLPAALILFLLTAPVFTFFIQPLTAHSMRKHEFEADEFAAQQSDAADLIRALVKLYEENASTLTPDPLYSAFHDSHPPAPIRISHLKTRLQTT
jgi:STE24 endopeptidase